jgi:hypothetical protein
MKTTTVIALFALSAAAPAHSNSAGPSNQGSTVSRLLNASTISCTFDPGYGGWWQDEKLKVGTVAFKGGPISFDSIDISAGRARMRASAGVVGSVSGETDVHVAPSSKSLNFYGIKPSGAFTVITVYGEVDDSGRYLAAMSSHGDTVLNHETLQVFGACDILLSNPAR